MQQTANAAPWRSPLAAVLLLALAAGCRAPDVQSPPYVRPYVPFARREVVGRSVQGRPIKLAEVGRGREVVLVLAAFHGDEWQSTYVAERLRDSLIATGRVPRYRKVVIVTAVNPDGLHARRRTNAHRVDLNRNFPAANWRVSKANGPTSASEPETRVVMKLLARYRPYIIVSIHTMGRGRHCVNYDGPAEHLADAMSRECGYPVRADIGYPTPGSFGTYAGKERQIPTITLELPRAATGEQCWRECRDALLAAVGFVGRPGLRQAATARRQPAPASALPSL